MSPSLRAARRNLAARRAALRLGLIEIIARWEGANFRTWLAGSQSEAIV